MADETLSRNRRALTWFLIATFGITWALWSPLFLFHIHLHGSRSGDLLITVLGAIGMYVPGVSALAVTRWALGESWRTTTLDRLGSSRFYLWALFLPPVLVAATVGLTIVLGGARFDPEFGQLRKALLASGKPMPAMSLRTLMLIEVGSAAFIGPIINAFFAVGEEVGWRGFLLPRLMTIGLGEWPALLLSGAIWGLWHAPLILRGAEYFGHPYLGVPMFIGFATLLGIVLGWMWLAARSVWVTAVAHGSINAWVPLALVVLTPFDMIKWGILNSLSGCVTLLALVVWLAWSRRLPVTMTWEQNIVAPLDAAPSKS